MRRHVSIWIALLIMVIVHVDWHFGRGHHHRLSLSLPYHWILGLVTFFLLALYSAKKWPQNTIGAAVLNGVLGLFAGQIVEPLLEVIGYRVPMGEVFTPERWRIFGQFAVASVVGLLAGFAVVWGLRRGRPVQPT